jgi:hypothetical protein
MGCLDNLHPSNLTKTNSPPPRLEKHLPALFMNIAKLTVKRLDGYLPKLCQPMVCRELRTAPDGLIIEITACIRGVLTRVLRLQFRVCLGNRARRQVGAHCSRGGRLLMKAYGSNSMYSTSSCSSSWARSATDTSSPISDSLSESLQRCPALVWYYWCFSASG